MFGWGLVSVVDVGAEVVVESVVLLAALLFGVALVLSEGRRSGVKLIWA